MKTFSRLGMTSEVKVENGYGTGGLITILDGPNSCFPDVVEKSTLIISLSG